MSESGSFSPPGGRQLPQAMRGTILIAPPFPAIARAKDLDDSRFEEAVSLEDLRAHSLSVRLSRAVRPGAAIFIVIGIGSDHPSDAVAPAVAIRGVVAQAQAEPLGGFVVAISFCRYRFLFLPSQA